MSKIIKANFNNLCATFNSDGWINATEVAKHFDRRVDIWLKTDETKAYISSLMRFKTTTKRWEFIKTKQGRNGGTWINSDLAVFFARWISTDFAVWCDQKIKNILRNGNSKPIEWNEARIKAIVQRCALTDAINDHLLPLVKEQNPDSSYLKPRLDKNGKPINQIYLNYSTIPKQATSRKWKTRDELDSQYLEAVKIIEQVAARIIIAECRKLTPYKEIFQQVKCDCFGLRGVLRLESSH